MLLTLLHEDRAGTQLMPTQLYINIMLMIKNVFFCVTKCKADNPSGKFWVIILGTDQLEELFGILWTMVGNNTNLNVLQLDLCLTATTEVSTILAKYPHWDQAPHRLKLPALSKDGLDIHDGVDHIKSASWCGDVNVSHVNLQTCWKLGHQMVQSENPWLGKIMYEMDKENDEGCLIDILHPFGKDIVKAEHDADDYDDTVEDFDETAVSNSVSPEPDLEDTVVEEEPSTKHGLCFNLGGKKVYKAQYHNQVFKYFKIPGSCDCLKHAANINEIRDSS
jgi:hypothetical protein